MSTNNLIIYCDESSVKERYFSHFYGGALISANDRERINTSLQNVKDLNNLGAELKWTKISEAYKDKYIKFIDAYFDHIQNNDIKIRIMFTQNSNQPIGLEDHQIDNQYWLLYYQLIKHAFGLMHCGTPNNNTNVSIYLDDIPDNKDKFSQFREYVASLSKFPKFRSQLVSIQTENITDVNSKNHVILQGLDIILGSMQFRLNDKHLEKPSNSRRRSKRTVAKELVYKHISKRIRDIYPNFNIGVSTSVQGDINNRWLHPYRHWLFVPSEHRILTGVGKQRNRKAPRETT